MPLDMSVPVPCPSWPPARQPVWKPTWPLPTPLPCTALPTGILVALRTRVWVHAAIGYPSCRAGASHALCPTGAESGRCKPPACSLMNPGMCRTCKTAPCMSSTCRLAACMHCICHTAACTNNTCSTPGARPRALFLCVLVLTRSPCSRLCLCCFSLMLALVTGNVQQQ